MSQIDVNQLLAQMRAIASQIENKPDAAQNQNVQQSDFGALLKESIDKVNQNQQEAAKLAGSFETGESNTDLVEVMLALQKADLSFKAMTEVRNRLVNAYQEIMNMPI